MGNANTSQSPETDAGKEAGANREEDADRKARAAGEEETQGGTGPRPGSPPGPDSNSGSGSSHGGAGRQTETSPPGTGRAGDKEESASSARARPAGTQPARRQRDWDAFAFQHEKLKHLTTVGLVLSGGIITLFQSEMMEPSPPALIALVLPVVSSMLTLAAQVSLGNEASTTEPMAAERTRDSFGVPVAVHWVGLAALFLLASSLGWLASFFFRDTGLLP
ncbi:hypothetical protein GGP97_003101 [Salinibacter ruber]|nr:hypothetical protein [Salinibacter ruber]